MILFASNDKVLRKRKCGRGINDSTLISDQNYGASDQIRYWGQCCFGGEIATLKRSSTLKNKRCCGITAVTRTPVKKKKKKKKIHKTKKKRARGTTESRREKKTRIEPSKGGLQPSPD